MKLPEWLDKAFGEMDEGFAPPLWHQADIVTWEEGKTERTGVDATNDEWLDDEEGTLTHFKVVLTFRDVRRWIPDEEDQATAE